MKLIKIFLLILAMIFSYIVFHYEPVFAQNDATTLKASAVVGQNNNNNSILNNFVTSLEGDYFIGSTSNNAKDTIGFTFFQIAFAIKNVFLLIAVIFLVIGVIRLFLTDASDEDVSKWKRNIVWTTAGIIFMQVTMNVWLTFLKFDSNENPLNAKLGWEVWQNIVQPLVMLFQYFASFAFLAMMIYAFYIIVTGGGDEEKFSKGKNTLIFALVGFILIQVPHRIVSAMYGGIPQCNGGVSSGLWALADPCPPISQEANFEGGIEIVVTVITFLNNLLTVFCVIMAIYAGWLLFISRGEEEKISKAKRIILYIVIGLILLVASHAIFRFFIMKS